MPARFVSTPDGPEEDEDDHNIFRHGATDTSEDTVEYDDYIVYSTKVPNHSCTLPEAQDIINEYIYGGYFVQLRRNIKKCLLVNGDDPESKARLKSSASIREEKERHLKDSYYMIHPFSSARVLWEAMMIFIYIGSFLIIGTQVILSCYRPDWIFYLECSIVVPLVTDIVLWFYTGYFDEDKQVVVMDQRKVIHRYLFSFFITDCFAALPLNGFFLFIDEETKRGWDWTVDIIELMARLPRIITLDRYIKKFVKRHKIKGFFQNSLTLGLTLILMTNWAASLLFAFSCRRPTFTRFVTSHFVVVSRFMLVGVATTEPAPSVTYAILELFHLMIGCVLSKFIIIKVTALYTGRVTSEQEYWNLVRQMNEYMKYRLLPKHVKKRVYQFINFKFQRNVYNEELILDTLSDTLKEEINLHNCSSLVESVKFFRDIPLTIIARISSKLKPEIYLPSDVIIQARSIGNVMYFIQTGTVAVYTRDGKEICHLKDGSHFGEISLVVREPRTATVKAITECALFRLSRRDFRDAIAPFPELASKIMNEAMARMEHTLKITGPTKSEVIKKRGHTGHLLDIETEPSTDED